MKSYSIHYHKYSIFADNLNKNGITKEISDYRQECGFTKLDKNTWIDETKVFDIYGKKVWEKQE